ncbi:MAG: hypothetical protein ACRDAI_01560 [Candidatus Rhabdochlamydia sp.]
MTIPLNKSTIFVTNPEILKVEKQPFLDYLKIFVNNVHSGKNLQKTAPKGIEKAVDTFSIQARVVGYSTFAGYLCTSIVKQVKNFPFLSVTGAVLSTIDTLSFGAIYGLSAVRTSYQLAKDQNLSDLLKKEDALVLKQLVQSLSKPISSHLDQLKTSWNTLDPTKQQSKKQQFKQKAQEKGLERLQTQGLALGLSQSDLEELLKTLQTQDQSEEVNALLGLTDQDYWQLTPLEALGLMIDQEMSKTRNWSELKELSSLQTTQGIDKAYRRGLLERINSTNPVVKGIAKKRMKALVGRVRAENSQTKRIHTALVTIYLLGAIASTVGVLTLPFGVGIAIAALSSVVAISSTGFKTYLSKKKLADSPCGAHDKALVITAAVLLGVSLIALSGITLVFGLSLLQLGLALGIGGFLGGGFLGYQYHLLSQKDQLWKEAHPSLEVFQTFILEKRNKKEGWDKEVHELFKKLPKDLRQAIRQDYEKRDSPKGLTKKNEISAFKKTSKHFWNQWLISGSEEDRKLALEVQGLYDSLRLNKKSLEKLNFLKIDQPQNINQRVKEQLEKDRKYIFYRKSSLGDLYEVTKTISQKFSETSLPFPLRLRQRG